MFERSFVHKICHHMFSLIIFFSCYGDPPSSAPGCLSFWRKWGPWVFFFKEGGWVGWVWVWMVGGVGGMVTSGQVLRSSKQNWDFLEFSYSYVMRLSRAYQIFFHCFPAWSSLRSMRKLMWPHSTVDNKLVKSSPIGGTFSGTNCCPTERNYGPDVKRPGRSAVSWGWLSDLGHSSSAFSPDGLLSDGWGCLDPVWGPSCVFPGLHSSPRSPETVPRRLLNPSSRSMCMAWLGPRPPCCSSTAGDSYTASSQRWTFLTLPGLGPALAGPFPAVMTPGPHARDT